MRRARRHSVSKPTKRHRFPDSRELLIGFTAGILRMSRRKYRELRWLFRQAKPLFQLHALSLAFITSGSILTLLDPLIMKWLIDVVLPQKDGRLLLVGTFGFAIVYLGRLGLVYCGSLISFIAVQKMVFRTRLKLIRKLHLRSAEYHEAT